MEGWKGNLNNVYETIRTSLYKKYRLPLTTMMVSGWVLLMLGAGVALSAGAWGTFGVLYSHGTIHATVTGYQPPPTLELKTYYAVTSTPSTPCPGTYTEDLLWDGKLLNVAMEEGVEKKICFYTINTGSKQAFYGMNITMPSTFSAEIFSGNYQWVLPVGASEITFVKIKPVNAPNGAYDITIDFLVGNSST